MPGPAPPSTNGPGEGGPSGSVSDLHTHLLGSHRGDSLPLPPGLGRDGWPRASPHYFSKRKHFIIKSRILFPESVDCLLNETKGFACTVSVIFTSMTTLGGRYHCPHLTDKETGSEKSRALLRFAHPGSNRSRIQAHSRFIENSLKNPSGDDKQGRGGHQEVWGLSVAYIRSSSQGTLPQ